MFEEVILVMQLVQEEFAQNGTVLKSIDAGLSWNLQNSGTTKYLKSVSFPTPNVGWAVGDSGIVISTTNGGSGWSKYRFNKSIYFSGVCFPDIDHGYLSSDHGLYSTSDGGVTWKEPGDDTYFHTLTAVHAPSAKVVCIVGVMCRGSSAMTSHDGGISWVQQPAGDAKSVYFADDMHGTAVGTFGSIYHTINGGASWSAQKSNTYNNLYGVCFGSTKAGTAVGFRGNIIRIKTNE